MTSYVKQEVSEINLFTIGKNFAESQKNIQESWSNQTNSTEDQII